MHTRLIRSVGTVTFMLALTACATTQPKPTVPPRAATDEEKLTIARALLPLLAVSGLWRSSSDGCAAKLGVVPTEKVNLGVRPDERCKFSLFVTEGALRRLDPLELQAALAHEVAHVQLGHFAARTDRRKAEQQTRDRIDSAGAVGGVVGAIPIIGPLIAVGTAMTQTAAEVASKNTYRGYDRQEELAADALAVDLLNRVASGRCHALTALFARMRQDRESGPTWWSTHPSFAARGERAAAACRSAGEVVSPAR